MKKITMKKTLISTALAAAAIAGATSIAGLVYADKVSQAEQAALTNAKIDLVTAITLAQEQVEGQVIEAELGREDGAYVYEIEIAVADGVQELLLDPASGEVLSNVLDTDDHDHRKSKKLKKFAPTQLNLTQAVAAAEEHLTGGIAKEAELEYEDGQLLFEVELLKDGKEYEVYVSPNDGKILASERG